MKIRPARFISGRLKLPGDKSISHRAALLAAMADGETRIDNFAASADCASTLACLALLGVDIRRHGPTILINGAGKKGFEGPSGALDCGNSGTTLRLLAGILAGQPFTSILTGDASLNKRPMGRIIEPLGLMGARVTSDNGHAPLTIRGVGQLNAIDYQLPVASAQLKSCILLAGLSAAGMTSVIEPVPTRDHTERMLRWFGVDAAATQTDNGLCISVPGDSHLQARDLSVPSDISSAAFFMVAAACLEGSDINFTDLGVNPTRRGIIDVMATLGARIEVSELRDVCNEPVATVRVRGGLDASASDRAAILRGDVIANLIDEIPVLAVLGTCLPSGLEIRNAAELRVKESDRISATVRNLQRMGADVTEFSDGFRVERSHLHGATIDTVGDHRIAMAFAVAGLLASGETEIAGAGCADISFPGFFETLRSVVR